MTLRTSFYPVDQETVTSTDLISLSDLKAHLRVTHDAEDDLITALLDTAIQAVENMTNRVLGSRSAYLIADDWASQVFSFGPITAITTVEYYDGANTLQTLPSTLYWYDIQSTPARITFLSPPTVYSDRHQGIRITATIGHDAIPPALRQAILLLVGHYYETRQAVVLGPAPHEVPMAVRHLVNPWRLFP